MTSQQRELDAVLRRDLPAFIHDVKHLERPTVIQFGVPEVGFRGVRRNKLQRNKLGLTLHPAARIGAKRAFSVEEHCQPRGHQV